MSIAEVKGLTKQYPSFTLSDVSFPIEAGRITGFIGRNGAGKTTTIKAMLNLVHPDGGAVSFFGLPLTENESKIKTRIGYSTGTVGWYPRKKIKDIVGVVKHFYSTWDEDAYRKYLDLFGLDENKAPIELSEGMKVKFNLLLALSHRAEVLILDEPTSGLEQHGVAVFFSTHIISDLEKCADDIVYISKGKIVAALPKNRFAEQYSEPGETLEQTMLRMEGGVSHA